jgi:acetolactate synthase-1/2/3 large subunit
VSTAADTLVARLVAAQTTCVFFVPGESFLDILDALHDETSIRPIVCRHEAAAGNMADAYGKLTGRPGVCLVSRGPGAAHVSIACHTAMQDGTPMIVIIADVTTDERDREAFQEVDFNAMFAPLAKRVLRVDFAHRLDELLDTAFKTAVAGRPGPVVVTIPEDVLSVHVPQAPPRPDAHDLTSALDASSLGYVADHLARAERPIILAGGGGWTQGASDALAEWASAHGIPIATAFRCQDVIDNESPAYVGHLGMGTSSALWDHLASADLVINIGARFDAPTTRDFAIFERDVALRVIIHFYPDPEVLSRWPFPHVGLVASPEHAVRALAGSDLPAAPGWQACLTRLRTHLEQWRQPAATSSPVDLGAIVAALPAMLGPHCVITNGAGNYTTWVHRYFRFREVGSYLGPRNGAMGYGVPAAIAAKLLKPDAHVVAFAGDGCFMMAGHELATIKRYGLKIILIVINNGQYGTIRMHQERRFPDRPIGTDLTNPDFTKLAGAHGLPGHLVERTEQFFPAMEAALQSDEATLIELRTPPRPATATDQG